MSGETFAAIVGALVGILGSALVTEVTEALKQRRKRPVALQALRVVIEEQRRLLQEVSNNAHRQLDLGALDAAKHDAPDLFGYPTCAAIEQARSGIAHVERMLRLHLEVVALEGGGTSRAQSYMNETRKAAERALTACDDALRAIEAEG